VLSEQPVATGSAPEHEPSLFPQEPAYACGVDKAEMLKQATATKINKTKKRPILSLIIDELLTLYNRMKIMCPLSSIGTGLEIFFMLTANMIANYIYIYKVNTFGKEGLKFLECQDAT
jgi:hypothetical protein